MSSKVAARRERILELMQRRGAVDVGDLSELLGVSPQTVRRDINHLCDISALRRRHGGAALFEPRRNLPYDERRTTNTDAKRAIAAAVAAMIPSGATLFISVGTTPAMVAQALRRHRQLTVVTNNLNAAMALSHETTNRIILPGGEMRLPDRDILGDHVVRHFAGYRAEFGIFGVGGIAEDGGLLDFHMTEVQVREQIRASCQVSVLVADRSKFGRMAPAVGGTLRDVDRIVIDVPPPAPFAALIEAVPERVTRAGGEAR